MLWPIAWGFTENIQNQPTRFKLLHQTQDLSNANTGTDQKRILLNLAQIKGLENQYCWFITREH